MNVPTPSRKRLVIVGATGIALRCALEHPAVGSATAIVRKKLDTSHPKLNEVVRRAEQVISP
jgi:hypothetical protein